MKIQFKFELNWPVNYEQKVVKLLIQHCQTPPQVWTALLNYGYVGCIRDLFVDGQSKDIRRLAEAQRAVGVKPSCSREPPKQCLSNPCQHNGNCREGWNRYVCDCSGTGYLGRSCERGESHRMPFWRGKGRESASSGLTVEPVIGINNKVTYSE